MTGGDKGKQRRGKRRERGVIAYGTRRPAIDAHKVSRAILALAVAKAEVEAQAAHEAQLETEKEGQNNA